MAAKTAGKSARVKVRRDFPTRRRTSIVFATAEGPVTLTALWVTAGAWRGRPESLDPAWVALPFGPFVLGLRLDG